jgi:glycosyltransferase involved in cell wall biosynthesis
MQHWSDGMNIAMFTNAYEPIVGGLERSIATFTDDFCQMGHRTLVVTLDFPGADKSDERVFRLPSFKEVGGTEFSVRVPVPAGLKKRLELFAPDIIHSHHPFMLGDTALRVSRKRGLPLVFTHHTLYEGYAYVFGHESEMFRIFSMAIATEYANLCDLVIAPTNSIRDVIRSRGVRVPIEVIPTGIDIELCGSGQREEFRKKHGIPAEAFVLGYLGRAVKAKNMDFLAQAAVRFLLKCPEAWFLLAGDGESAEPFQKCVQEAGVAERVVMTGKLEGRAVTDAYAAMDLFAFASKTETQGIVLLESLCAGVPIVALDAAGTRDLIRNGKNGTLLRDTVTSEEFAEELCRVKKNPELLFRWRKAARERAGDFDRKRCAGTLLDVYGNLMERSPLPQAEDPRPWVSLHERFMAEWNLLKEKMTVLAAATTGQNRHLSDEPIAGVQK